MPNGRAYRPRDVDITFKYKYNVVGCLGRAIGSLRSFDSPLVPYKRSYNDEFQFIFLCPCTLTCYILFYIYIRRLQHALLKTLLWSREQFL